MRRAHRCDDFDVGAGARVWVDHRRAREIEGGEIHGRWERQDGVGIAEVNGQRRKGLVAVDVDEGVEAVALGRLRVCEMPRSEVHGVQIALDPDGLGAGARGNGELLGGLESLAAQIGSEDPGPVAAQLRCRTVGVAIVHEPPGRPGLVSHVLLARCLRGKDSDHAISTQARAPVRQEGNFGVCEGQRAVEVGDQDEVVLGAVALGESEGARHQSIVAACSVTHARADRRPGSGSVVSNQATRGSGRNHDSWRRANRRVA